MLPCRFIYTGSVDIRKEIAQELLIAADQYLLEGLKRLCEFAIAKVSCICIYISILVVIILAGLIIGYLLL